MFGKLKKTLSRQSVKGSSDDLALASDPVCLYIPRCHVP